MEYSRSCSSKFRQDNDHDEVPGMYLVNAVLLKLSADFSWNIIYIGHTLMRFLPVSYGIRSILDVLYRC